jgi:hypothetical protein
MPPLRPPRLAYRASGIARKLSPSMTRPIALVVLARFGEIGVEKKAWPLGDLGHPAGNRRAIDMAVEHRHENRNPLHRFGAGATFRRRRDPTASLARVCRSITARHCHADHSFHRNLRCAGSNQRNQAVPAQLLRSELGRILILHGGITPPLGPAHAPS